MRDELCWIRRGRTGLRPRGSPVAYSTPLGAVCGGHLRPRGKPGVNESQHLITVGTFELEARRTDPRRALPYLRLYQLDQLDELGVGVEAKERQEPIIERAGLVPL